MSAWVIGRPSAVAPGASVLNSFGWHVTQSGRPCTARWDSWLNVTGPGPSAERNTKSFGSRGSDCASPSAAAPQSASPTRPPNLTNRGMLRMA